MINFEILEISSHLGENIVSPASLFDDDDGRISVKTGINILHRSQKTAFELAINAANENSLIKKNKENIEHIIYVTQSPQNYLPNHASQLQNSLDINNNCMCFDINQGCSGFVQALFVAINLLRSQSKKLALIVCTDTYSQHLSKTDRSTQALFSDGATATLISSGSKWKLRDFSHYTDGSGADFLIKTVCPENRLTMNGIKVFQWTRKILGKQILNMLNKCQLPKDDVDEFYLHQASKLVIENVRRGLDVSEKKIPTTLEITGNLVSSSLPFLIQHNFENFCKNKVNVLSGFGVGLSCSSMIIEKIS